MKSRDPHIETATERNALSRVEASFCAGFLTGFLDDEMQDNRQALRELRDALWTLLDAGPAIGLVEEPDQATAQEP
jgi:hypothetical protein